MPAALTTTVTELEDSRVRLRVQVPAAEVEGSVERKARELGRQLKLPGFRRGKVPPPLVIQRIGREAVLEEAVRDTISSWYSDAIERSGIVPVGDPQLNLGELPPKGEALEFSIEIGVLPTATLGRYRGLEVGRREPLAADELLEQEVEAMRERLARLQTAERPAAEGDFVVVDYVGSLVAGTEAAAEEGARRPQDGGGGEGHLRLQPFAGGEGRDQLIELGGGNLIPGFEEGLLGAAAGETRTIALRFPEGYGNEQLAGREASFEVTVKEVKVKQLPALDEDFAIDAGFDDLEQLREDIRRRLLEADEQRVQAEFRQAALDAAVANAQVAVTPELAQARAREMWERMLHSLAHRGVSREAYLRVAGRPEQEILADMQGEAEQALRREAVITAVVAAEGIAPSDEQLLEALAATAEREGVEPARLLEQLRAAARLEEAREELAAREAIDLIAGSAEPIPLAQAQARERLWTPEKEQAAAGAGAEQAAGAPGRLWTPTGDAGAG
ncbi:MAG TPA: trigger factor [Solirubrobacteraceae bacterium]|nr:trigger factor [Solirubrobacteraceae bacterium]